MFNGVQLINFAMIEDVRGNLAFIQNDILPFNSNGFIIFLMSQAMPLEEDIHTLIKMRYLLL